MLVGRRGEVEQLITLSQPQEVVAGGIHIIHVEGDIGVGKSALLSSVLTSLDGDWHLTHGQRAFQQGPLGGLRAMIESLLGADLETLLEDHQPSTLARMSAERLTNRHTIIAVDDAQWLNPPSIEFFRALIETPICAGLSLIIVNRPGQAPEELLALATVRGARYSSVTVHPLSDEAIASLVSPLERGQSESAIRASRGNPLFAQTVSAAFRRHPQARHIEEVLRLESRTRSAILDAAVADDIAALSAHARRVLEALSVLGNTRDPRTIARVADLTEPLCADGLEQLSDKGLLSSHPHETLHPVVRLSVYQQASRAWLRLAHRAAADLSHSDLFLRAEHLAAVGPGLRCADIEVLTEAAKLAIGSDPRSVFTWLNSIPEQLRTPATETLLARAEILNGDVLLAIERLRPFSEGSAPDTEATVLLANALRLAGQAHEARSLLSRNTDDMSPALLREMIDVVALLDDHFDDAPLDRLADMPGTENEMAVRIYRTMRQLSSGALREARVSFNGVADWVHSAPMQEIRDTLHAVACAVWCAYMLDDFRAGVQMSDRALRIAERLGQVDVLGNLWVGSAFCLTQLGRIDEAERDAHRALQNAEQYAMQDTIGMARAVLAITSLSSRDSDLIRERYSELCDAPIPAFSWWRRAVQGIRVRTSAILGQPEPYETLLGFPRDALLGLHLADAALSAAAQGEPELAGSLIEQGLAFTQEQGARSQQAMLESTYGELLLRQGTPDALREAQGFLNRAHATYLELGLGLHIGRVSALLNQVAEARNNLADPLEPLTQREREVAILIAEGHSNKEIAGRLVISPRTAEEHASNVIKKLKLPSRAALGVLLATTDVSQS